MELFWVLITLFIQAPNYSSSEFNLPSAELSFVDVSEDDQAEVIETVDPLIVDESLVTYNCRLSCAVTLYKKTCGCVESRCTVWKNPCVALCNDAQVVGHMDTELCLKARAHIDFLKSSSDEPVGPDTNETASETQFENQPDTPVEEGRNVPPPRIGTEIPVFMKWKLQWLLVVVIAIECAAKKRREITCYSCWSKNWPNCKTVGHNTAEPPLVQCKRGQTFRGAGCLKFVGKDNERKRTVVLRGCAHDSNKTCKTLRKLSRNSFIEVKYCSVCTTSLCNGSGYLGITRVPLIVQIMSILNQLLKI